MFVSNYDEGVDTPPFLYAKDRTAVYTVADAWSSLLVTSPCRPDSGVYSWAYRVSSSCRAEETPDFDNFHFGLTRDPTLSSQANLSTNKSSWCVNADGDTFLRGERLMDRSAQGLPPMNASIPAFVEDDHSTGKDKEKEGGDSQRGYITALQAARDYGCDMVVQFLFDSSRGVLLCRFRAEQARGSLAADAAGAGDSNTTLARVSCSEWQVVCTGLGGMVLYPAVSVYSSEVRVGLVRQPIEGSSSIQSALQKATLAAEATIAATALNSANEDRQRGIASEAPSNLSHAFARSFAELIRTKARAAGIRGKGSGSNHHSGASGGTSRNALGICPVGAPSSLLVGYALKLTTTVTDMLGDDRGTRATHPLFAHLLLHLVAWLVKCQHLCESQAPVCS